MLCRLHIAPLRVFQEIVQDPEKYKELPDDIRKQICKPNATAGNEKTPGGGESTNATIRQLRDTVGEQHDRLQTCIQQLSALEDFKKEALDTRVKLEDRVASLDLMKQQLDNTVLRFKRKTSKLEKENEELQLVTKVQRNIHRFMNGKDFSMAEIIDQKSPTEQIALLLPMVGHLREENEKIRRNYIEMEKKVDAEKNTHLVKTQELRADLRETEGRLVKAEAKRDRYKQMLRKINKEQKEKQKLKQAHNPIIVNESNNVTITPGITEPYQQETKPDVESLSLPKKSRTTSSKGLNSFNPKQMKRRFGFMSSLKSSGSRLSSASISSGFNGRGGSSKVVVTKTKRRRLGNSLFLKCY